MVYCGSCQTAQSLTEFRLLSPEPPCFVDFCKTCEGLFGTVSLYNKPSLAAWVNRAAKKIVLSGDDKTGEGYQTQAVDYQEEQKREFARRELARKYLLYYVKQFNPTYDAGWVHKDIARRLEQFVKDIEDGLSPRLMLFMPPRHGKSTLASIELPSWVLGRHPEWEIISASYAVSLPIGFSRMIKDRLKEPDYSAIFPGTKLRKDAQGVEEWFTTSKGRYQAAGVEVGVTGKGCVLLVVDDPIKDYQEAQSPKVRENAYNWYTSTARTRLAPGGGVLLIQCMTGDTAVTMADGSWERLDRLTPGDMVLAYDAGRHVAREVLNWTPQGEDDILEIRTGTSRVRANARHPLLVERKSGAREWVKAAALQRGDKLVTSAIIEHGLAQTISPEQAWLLGYMFGDGWITVRDAKNYDKKRDKYYPRRALVTCVAFCKDEEFNATVEAAFLNLFGVAIKRTKYGYWRTEIQSIGRWFYEHGLTGNAKTKRIPVWMYAQPLYVREAFLLGYNNADGAVFSTGASKGRWTHSSCSELLIRDVRHLARSCGLRVTNISTATKIIQAPNSPAPTESFVANVQWSLNRVNETEFAAASSIRSVESVGRALVYDIQVDRAECFIADGVVSHNTRWHDADLSGQLLTDKQNLLEAGIDPNEIDDWHVVSYPALAEYDEYLFPDRTIQVGPQQVPEGAIMLRPKDEALHPARYTALDLRRIRNTMPSVQWNALFQQNPVPDTGEYFTRDMFRSYAVLPGNPEDFAYFMAWDLAIGEKAQNDWTVGTVCAYHYTGAIYILDMVRARMNAPSIIASMIAQARKWPHLQVCGIEQGQIYKTMAPLLDEAMKREKVRFSLADYLKPVTDKMLRARPLQQKMQMGLVHFPAAQPWVGLIEREMLRFPSGAHDDIVDSLAWLIRMSMVISPPRPQKMRNQGRKPDSWKKQLVAKTGAKSFMTA